MSERKIKRIFFEGETSISSTAEEPIEKFEVNGEMAKVDWYRKGNFEYNGKFVQVIEYYEN